jgi:hypothetical protein
LSAISLRDYVLGTLAALPALLDMSLGACPGGPFGLDGRRPAASKALLAPRFAATALVAAHVGALLAKVADGVRTPPA